MGAKVRSVYPLKTFDYLIVGAGLYGSVFAFRAKRAGKKVLVIDRRPHRGGNLYCEKVEGINVHKYGAHIFHTSNRAVWDFVNSLVEFNNFVNCPIANYKGEIFNLPFNMNTFYALWGTMTPQEAKSKMEEQKKTLRISKPRNLEEQAISMVGPELYEILIKGYTEKQWSRKATELPASIVKRLPVRFTFDNNYFDDRYQGVPIGGYNKLINKLLKDIQVECNVDFISERGSLMELAKRIVYTGQIDEYFGYCYGKLEYRSLRFEEEIMSVSDFQGNAVVNYTDPMVPYTRVIEHKHFEFGQQDKTVITREYPADYSIGIEPLYPINDRKNELLCRKYKQLGRQEKNVVFRGRLGEYKYYNMDQIVFLALNARV